MQVDLFDFALPNERIALRPASPRDSARMLVLDGVDTRDRQVRDLPACLRPGDVLVFNDTRVIPAQLEGRRGATRSGRSAARNRTGRPASAVAGHFAGAGAGAPRRGPAGSGATAAGNGATGAAA